MNREKRRKFTKELKAKGFSKDKIVTYLNFATKDSKVIIPEGTKVKLDIEKIKAHPDYEKRTPKNKKWIDDNIDNIFTVKYEEYYGDNPVVVAFLEDEIGWNFHVMDLIVVKE
jgi:hypothetical protein